MHSSKSWRKNAAQNIVRAGWSAYSCEGGEEGVIVSMTMRLIKVEKFSNFSSLSNSMTRNTFPSITSLHPPANTITSDNFVSIVGFGSLLSKNSALYTSPNLRNFSVVRVRGYRRVFAHTSPIFFSRNIARKETREIASLSVEECEDASFIGCRFEIPMEEYPALAMREAEFNFTAVVTRDVETNEVVGEEDVKSVCCVRGSDALYTSQYCKRVLFEGREEDSSKCECVKCALKEFGEPMIWTDELIFPTRTYCRHCVLAARGLGKAVEDDFLDNTFLADRKTRLREHLERDPSILEELPPESLAVRYGG